MFSIHRMHVGPSDMAAVDVQAPSWVTAPKLATGSIRRMRFAACAPAGSAPLTLSRRQGACAGCPQATLGVAATVSGREPFDLAHRLRRGLP